jgi:diguanylate cyclase (GGDEF)-like protein
VLATLAARIRESVRQEDTVGRTGGDEVLVVLPGLRGIDQLAHISEKIRSRAAEPIHESGQTIRATLSIGATIAVPGETVSSVIARADAAMYQAKSGDRNTVVLGEPSEPSSPTAR